jgi:hypothetical protein
VRVAETFHNNAVDGPHLLQIDDKSAAESLGIHHSLKRKKLLIQLEILKRRQTRLLKVIIFVTCIEIIDLFVCVTSRTRASTSWTSTCWSWSRIAFGYAMNSLFSVDCLI